MKAASLNRDEFIGWLGGQFEPEKVAFTTKSLKSGGRDQILLVWEDGNQPNALPVIAIPIAHIRDFFAFVSTYVSSYRPFSAYFSVLPVEQLERIVSGGRFASTSGETYSKLIAVAFSEAFSQARGKLRSLDDLSVQGVKATLSASLMSAIYKGFGADELAVIAERWVAARQLFSGGELAIEPGEILEVWQQIGVAVESQSGAKRRSYNKPISGYIADFFSGTHSFDDWFRKIAIDSLGSDSAIIRLQGAREERVRALPTILDVFSNANSDRATLEFVAGGLLSMVGNGSMSQLPLTEVLVEQYPKSTLWFGLMSAFQSRSDALYAGNCLGRRVLRDVLRDVEIFGPPTHDLSIDELSVLGDKVPLIDALRTDHSGTINVGLLSSVQAPFRRPSAKRDSDAINEQVERRQIEEKRIEELRYLLERASRLLREVQSPSQRDLFEGDSRRSRKPR